MKPISIPIDSDTAAQLKKHLTKMGHVKPKDHQYEEGTVEDPESKKALFRFVYDAGKGVVTIHPMHLPADVTPEKAREIIVSQIEQLKALKA